jgi:pimeloyl-ACP methyl ester carboxylesterase
MWLRDFLPLSQSFQKSRIMSFGYDSTLVNKNSTDRIRDWADEMLRQISRVRTSEAEQLRPCILVCHSLGGLVAREAMLRLNSFPDKFDGIKLEKCGLVFLSSPHSGSMEADWNDLLANLLESTIGLRSHDILDQLRPFNHLSVDSSEAFASMKVIPPFHCFVEGNRTKIAGKDRMVGVMTLRHHCRS